MARLQQSLQNLFGFESFRPGQREVIELILNDRHTLAVLPTGLGKSLCYQLAAHLKPGITLVISPLIALMQDQVDSLEHHGIKNVTCISSILDPAEIGARYKDIERGLYRLVYVAPERCDSLRFQEIIRKSQIDLLVIDEAHCISKWGHDFRPHYRTLSQRLPQIKHTTILALTATATPAVQDDIIKALDQPDMQRIIGDFNRPNLHFEIFKFNRREEKDTKLIELLSGEKGSVLVYASTRKETRIVFDLLRKHKFNVGLYHAGLNPKERTKAHYNFQNDKTQIVVATVAFGMGIDKPDVRRIIHYNITGSLESYYQEVGRAGRDGQRAVCTLLYMQSDLRIQRFFIDQAYPETKQILEIQRMIGEAHPLPVSSEDLSIASGFIELSVNSALQMLYEQKVVRIMPNGKYLLMQPDIENPSIDFRQFNKRKAQDNSRLKKMIYYTDDKTCRRQYLLSYFGQTFNPPCNNCDVCIPQEKGLPVDIVQNGAIRATNESDSVSRAILQAAHDFGGRLGRTTISNTLLGSKRKNILNLRLNHSRAYGQLESYKHKLILKWIDELIARRFLYVTAEEYPKLKITEKGLQALKNGSLIALRELAEKPKKFEVISAQDELVTALSTERQENKEFNSELYKKLRDWRLQKAKSLKLPAYCILHNSTLKEISSSFPCNLESLEKIKGMGENKIEQFGSEIIDLIQGNLQAIKKKVQKTTKVNIHQKEIEDLLHQLEQEKKLSPKKAIKILNKLASYGYEQAIPKLLKLLKSNTNNAIIMKKVVEALGQLGNRSAIPELEDLLSDPSPIIRRSVVESLGKLRAIELKSKLQHMSEKEESEFVRFAAHDALELINEIDSPKEEHVNYIKESDEHDHDYFIRKIENSNIPVRSKNVLKANVKNVHSFLNLKPFEILRFKNCGRKSVREILQFQDELHKEYKIKLNGSHYSGPRTVRGRAKLTF